MTDKERAEQLGEKILRLQAEIEALEYVFMEFRIPSGYRPGHMVEPPFRQIAERISKEPSFALVVARRKELLMQALGDETNGNALSALYDAFFKPV